MKLSLYWVCVMQHCTVWMLEVDIRSFSEEETDYPFKQVRWKYFSYFQALFYWKIWHWYNQVVLFQFSWRPNSTELILSSSCRWCGLQCCFCGWTLVQLLSLCCGASCCVTDGGGFKIIFGSGSRLIIQTSEYLLVNPSRRMVDRMIEWIVTVFQHAAACWFNPKH